ncbi:MAG: chromosomal replication initiator protein DnaA [Granulosicoccus sp.]
MTELETLLLSAPLWDHCLTQLETELSEQQLNTWIRPLQAKQNQSQLCIMAPNRFVLDMVQNNFRPRIQEIATAFSKPEPIRVDLVIGTGAEIGGVRSVSSKSVVAGQPAALSAAPALSFVAKAVQAQNHSSNLNPLFTFDTLVEGKSNQFGRAAALRIGTDPGTAYNPFLIYGASGLGKTHLMQAIGNEILKNRPDARVMYVNSERYVGEMVNALQHNKINQFKQFYRGLDALLIDDVQFFAGKDQTQEEFFHNFNALFEGGQQIVLTCDRYPKEVNGLEDRLKTRFGWGLTVSVEPPELEMRVAILNSKAEQSGFTLPSDVSFFIAKQIRSNVRELEGALRRVMANSQLIGTPVTVEFAREALSDLMAVQAKMVTIENIQKIVAEYYKIRLADLSGKGRSRSIARPRQVAMALSKELTSKSLPEIGKAFGGRDHTTVMHACKRIIELRGNDSAIREDYENLLRTLST